MDTLKFPRSYTQLKAASDRKKWALVICHPLTELPSMFFQSSIWASKLPEKTRVQRKAYVGMWMTLKWLYTSPLDLYPSWGLHTSLGVSNSFTWNFYFSAQPAKQCDSFCCLTLPKHSKHITQMPIKKPLPFNMYIHLLPQQLQRTPQHHQWFLSPPNRVVPWVPQAHSSHVSLRIRWWWNDGSGSTHQSSRATRASGKAWMLEQWQLGSCWWLLVTMPSWNSKGKRSLLSLNPPNLFFMWKFILGGLVCDTFGRVFIPCPSCEAFFYNWGLLWPWWVDFWEPIEFSVWFHGRFAPQNEPTKIFEIRAVGSPTGNRWVLALELVMWWFPASNHCIKYPWDPM